MMLARFLGDGEADSNGLSKPCHVFGLEFPAGEWVVVESDLHARKLAGNPLFETDGDAPEVEARSEPEPEPDPRDDGDPEPDELTPEQKLAQLRAALTARGQTFHHKAGVNTLAKQLADLG